MNSAAPPPEAPAEENVDADAKEESPASDLSLATPMSEETSLPAPLEQEQPNVKVHLSLTT